MSNDTFDELRDVCSRPKLNAKYPFVTAEAVAALIAEIESVAVKVSSPPTVIALPRDPKDEPFIDLAVAGDGQFIVTWNERHLTYLVRQDTPEGKDFCARFPNIRIVTPPEFLSVLDAAARP
jgi:putative PIN family toxin of toxin-antitoxin system